MLPNNAVPPGFRCAQPGEQAALGRRLRRGQQFDIDEISCKQMNAISLARVSAYSFNDEIAASLGRVACLD
jgi:hypothetical protein